MKTATSRLSALLFAAWAIAVCVPPANAQIPQVVPATDGNTISSTLAAWTNLNTVTQYTFDIMAPGNYDIAAPPTPLPGPVIIRKRPALPLNPWEINVTITGNLRSTSNVVFEGLSLIGNVAGPQTSLTLDHVIVRGGLFGPGHLRMEFCAAEQGLFGPTLDASFVRNTFMNAATFQLQAAGNYNLFQNLFAGTTAPSLTGNIVGQNNYFAGPIPIDTDNLFVRLGETFPLDGPAFAPAPQFPGQLVYPLFSRFPINTTSYTVPTFLGSSDINGTAVLNTSLQIGADELLANSTDLVFPAWTICTMTLDKNVLRTGSTEDYPNVPIVNGGVTASVHVETRNIFRTKANIPPGDYRFVLVSEDETEVEELADLADGNVDANGILSADFTIPIGSLGGLGNEDRFDGFTEIRLQLGDSFVRPGVASAGINVDVLASDATLLIDTLKPALSGDIEINDVTVVGTITGTRKLCPPVTSLGTGSAPTQTPLVILSQTGALDARFSIGMTDAAATDRTPSNFLLTGPLNAGSGTYNYDLDSAFAYYKLGVASWGGQADDLPVAPGTTGASATHTGSTTTWRFVAPAATTTPPLAQDWTGNMQAFDRAGNASDVSVPIQFWWMPPGSTWARITGDNLNPKNPAFTWDLQINSTSGSAANFAAACVDQPVAQFLVCRALNSADIQASGWESLGGLDWSDPTAAPAIDEFTMMGPGGAVAFGDMVRNALGETLIVVVRATDPAGNVQDVGSLGTALTTSATLNDLNANNVYFAGPYQIPARLSTGEVDTTAAARYFLNRIDRPRQNGLFEIDPDETTYGSGPTVPITPLTACGQRIEAEITLGMNLPDVLPDNANPSVEFRLFENGRLVARGNILPDAERDPNLPMRFYVPSDLIDVAEGSDRNPYCDVFVSSSPEDAGTLTGPPADNVADFLNFAPATCLALNPSDTPDRLGDDGDPAVAGALNDNGTRKVGNRNRDVTYTLELFTVTSGVSSSRANRDPSVFYDDTPATIQFTVKAGTTQDSEPPRVKINTKVSDAGGARGPKTVDAVLARAGDSVSNK